MKKSKLQDKPRLKTEIKFKLIKEINELFIDQILALNSNTNTLTCNNCVNGICTNECIKDYIKECEGNFLWELKELKEELEIIFENIKIKYLEDEIITKEVFNI